MPTWQNVQSTNSTERSHCHPMPHCRCDSVNTLCSMLLIVGPTLRRGSQAHPADVVVAVCPTGYFHECDTSVYQQQMQLNYMGSVHAVKAVYDDMLKRNSGHICFVASTLALLGGSTQSFAVELCLQLP